MTLLFRLGALLVAPAALLPSSAVAGGLDVERWLERPGVKLLAVELYATWCKPCMEAVPRWRALHDKYRDRGLRLVVVAVQDPKAGCTNPGWNPDEVVCDDDGRIAEALGAGSSLPAAFLWSWQGHLLVRAGHVDQVEAAVERWIPRAPRVSVEAGAVEAAAAADAGGLVELVRTKVRELAKVDVVATEREKKRLDALKKRSLEARYDERAQCEVGKDLPANSLLEVSLRKASSRTLLDLKLLSAEDGCLVAGEAADWNPKQAQTSVAEAVSALLQRLRPEVQWPRRGGAGRGARLAPKEEEFRETRKEVALEEGGDEVVVRFESEPEGATVLEGSKMVCTPTPCSRALPVGRHAFSMQRERYQERREAAEVSERAKKVFWRLEPDFGWLSVTSEPSGLDVLVHGQVVGKTPLSRHELSPGAYELKVQGPCHAAWGKKGVLIERGREREERAALEPREGAIKVSVEDARGNDVEGEVFVDGERAGKAPGKPIKVSVCAKDVEVRSEAGTWRGALSIEEGATVKVAARIEGGRTVPGAAPGAVGGGGMVRVPAGEFWRGCSDRDRSCEADEKPGRKITLDAFEIDRTEVTVAAYRACVQGGGCTAPEGGTFAAGREDHPVTNVDWAQAEAFCWWAKKRLPTEAEWEKAARGTDGRVYPWGDEAPSCRRAVMADGGKGCGTGGTMPVGSKPEGASPYGAVDMAGNVWEWVADWYGRAYYESAPVRNPPGASGDDRVNRGGGWNSDDAGGLRASNRHGVEPWIRYVGRGFRCARSVP